MKSIHIEDCEWKYKVGKQNTVICPPDGCKFHVGNHELKGFPNPDTFERGKWKKRNNLHLGDYIV